METLLLGSHGNQAPPIVKYYIIHIFHPAFDVPKIETGKVLQNGPLQIKFFLRFLDDQLVSITDRFEFLNRRGGSFVDRLVMGQYIGPRGRWAWCRR